MQIPVGVSIIHLMREDASLILHINVLEGGTKRVHLTRIPHNDREIPVTCNTGTLMRALKCLKLVEANEESYTMAKAAVDTLFIESAITVEQLNYLRSLLDAENAIW